MSDDDGTRRRFESLALPHLDAAYNLARWLMRNDHDAEDAVHDAWLRAQRYFGAFRGEQVRPWLLQIVRHSCYSWLEANRDPQLVAFDDDGGTMAADAFAAPASDEPHTAALRNAERAQINDAIAALPIAFREVVVLRELEDLAYRDIARIADIPIGTVMSRLARGRSLLRERLAPAVRPALHSVRGGQGATP